MKKQRRVLPIDPAAHRWFWIVGVITATAWFLDWPWAWIPGLILMLVLAGFFRDPTRKIPTGPGDVVSPADGTITEIRTNTNPEAGPENGTCISIFLSVFNVHVNRSPFSGTVESIQYKPGRFLDARHPDCHQLNEANWIYMKCGSGQMTVRQISGLIARRIICRVKCGQELKTGERIGMICFGSRTELYLPPGARLEVEVGHKVRGGSTVMAVLPVGDDSADSST
jgi:phosphatidylserine decarboxylase